MTDKTEGLTSLVGTFDGTAATVKMRGFGCPATITLIPGAGCTVKASFTTSTEALVDAGTATYVDWPEGASSATIQVALISPVTAVKLTRTVGAATCSYEISV